MYLSRIFTWHFQCKEATLTKSSLPCKKSDKFERKCKFLISNAEAILTF